MALLLLAAACASPPPPQEATPRTAAAPPGPQIALAAPQSAPIRPPLPKPRIVKASRRLQCVPYARQLSGISLRGDAWSWWRAAAGRYPRASRPRVGSVMVLGRSKRLRRGHLAVVAAVLGPRQILVHQANWLNRGRVHEYVPVKDVSPANDWSVVRVWYTPGKVYGKRRYGVAGFIYPDDGAEPRGLIRPASTPASSPPRAIPRS